MNYIQQAIEKSIEGGWKKGEKVIEALEFNEKMFESHPHIATITKSSLELESIINPLFWQSLGKALGRCDVNDINPLHKIENKVICVVCKRKDEWWRETWHRFIDHLSEDKDPEKFFKELLK